MAAGECAHDNPFGFSTKYEDGETALVYYGFRYYAPGMGRWLNTDPIGEDGYGVLYPIVLNDPVSVLDYLGLYDLVFEGDWTEDGKVSVESAFCYLETYMSSYLARVDGLIKATMQVPDECDIKQRVQQELNTLRVIPRTMDYHLSSKDALTLRKKRMLKGTYARAMMRDRWDFAYVMDFNTHPKNSFEEWDEMDMLRNVFHEVSHHAGIPGEWEARKSEWWMDHAGLVDDIANHPTEFNIASEDSSSPPPRWRRCGRLGRRRRSSFAVMQGATGARRLLRTGR